MRFRLTPRRRQATRFLRFSPNCLPADRALCLASSTINSSIKGVLVNAHTSVCGRRIFEWPEVTPEPSFAA